MNDKKHTPQKLTSRDLSIYVGCHCMDSTKNEALILDHQLLKIYGGMNRLDRFMPILRPFKSISGPEGETFLAIRGGRGFVANIWHPDEVSWLIKRYFDLFGWIDAGLAIDATTCTPNPYQKIQD